MKKIKHAAVPPVHADPKAAAARRADGQHFDQQAMHTARVRAATWRRRHGLAP